MTSVRLCHRRLAKCFRGVAAVSGIDLRVARGAVFGLLGPNGAGKTTTIRMLATLLRPSAGSALVLGHEVVREPARVRAKVSLTGQFASVDEDLTGRENLVRRPELLFLDEPTTGLDPRSRNQVWDFARTIARNGTAVLLTTQYLEEADRLADRLAVIDRGRLIAEGSSGELKASVGSRALHVRLIAWVIAASALLTLVFAPLAMRRYYRER